MNHVFISYSNADRAAVDTICSFLESVGVPCWIAHRDEPAAEFYQTPIVEAIQSAVACVFVLTRNSNRSRDVANEVHLAFRSKRILVPFRLEKFQLGGDLLYYLDRVQTIDATAGLNEVALRQLGDVLKRLIGEASVQKQEGDQDWRACEAAAMRGDAEARYRLAVHYSDEQSETLRPAEAVRWFRAAAEQGHAESAWKLALAYRSGNGVVRSEPEAARWIQTAAKLGYAPAEFAWGQMLLQERGESANAREAAVWFDRAAAQGITDARYNLALLYLNGRGVERNYPRALEAMRECAGAGHAGAEYYLAWMLMHGYGAPADHSEALLWAERAAGQGHEMARRLVRELGSEAL
ncbi:toll/interleukin-1 receptor domain-containing protein [Paracidobacterium acidisoli]|nr:toll/interleukin-1 receptor domain-containing protein [Paracidobacterium acidisoli]MBT9331032.1 toll/interleukin-1 receptor domain-containing protein [Paracidobacterium acidisoli]